MPEHQPEHQEAKDVHSRLVEIDQQISEILTMETPGFLLCLDNAIKSYYETIRDGKNEDGSASDSNLEKFRVHKRLLIHILERMHDIEAGAKNRQVYHQIIDKALYYANVRFSNVPSDNIAIAGGMLELDRPVIVQDAVIDKSSLHIVR